MADKKPEYPVDPNLIGKNIYLRPATAEDVANTYHWIAMTELSMRSCRPLPFRTAAEAAEAYRKREVTEERQLFVIVRQKGNQPVGLIRYFGFNSLNRSAELGMTVDPDERRKGHGLEAIRLIAKYLFRMRDLNKVYAQTSELNVAAVSLLEKSGFKRDGVLRHHYYYDGELHDGYIYSLLRFEYER